jgi:LysM repeat protein
VRPSASGLPGRDASTTLPSVEEQLTKGRTWHGYVCPGCRTAFRVAADFSGSEVMCPSCNGTLRLPKSPEELQTLHDEAGPPLVDSATTPGKPSRPAFFHSQKRPSSLQQWLSSAGRQRNILAGLVLAGVLLTTAALLIPRQRTLQPVEEDAAPAVAASAAVEPAAPPPPPMAVNDMPVPEMSEPAVPEVITEAPPVEVPEVISEPEVAAAEPPKPPALNGEEDLVPAIPALPQVAAAPAALPDPGTSVAGPPTAAHATALIHTVVRGDTLSRISRKYQVSLATIKQANGMEGDIIMVGQRLRIPGAVAPAAAAQAARSHTVTQGDTLQRIALKYGVSPQQVMEANGMANDVVRLGHKLVIPAAP